MTENTNLLQKALKEVNEKDAEGAVSKIKSLIKLIDANDTQIAMYTKSNKELKKQINQLVSRGPAVANNYVISEQA